MMLAMITPPVILLIIVVVALVLIFIIPKMKKSTKLDNLNDGLFGSMDKSSTDSIINKVEQGKDALVDKIKQNADWLLKLTLEDIINLASKISAIQLFKRDMFQRRLDKGDTVWYHETLYPLLQGYDSVAMDVDLEIGGTDQTFNMLIGRELQQKINQNMV